MSGGWGTPARHRSTDDPPEGALCIEDGCREPVTCTRPATREWSAEGRVLAEPDEVVEWVCSNHAFG